MSIIDYLVIVVFTLLVVAAGLSFRKRGSDMKSYFAAGGAVFWSINGLSLYMSFFSAGTFVVWGWVAITIQMTMCVGGLIVAFIIAPKWRKTNVLTAAEFVRKRLSDTTTKNRSTCCLKLNKSLNFIFISCNCSNAGLTDLMSNGCLMTKCCFLWPNSIFQLVVDYLKIVIKRETSIKNHISLFKMAPNN